MFSVTSVQKLHKFELRPKKELEKRLTQWETPKETRNEMKWNKKKWNEMKKNEMKWKKMKITNVYFKRMKF